MSLILDWITLNPWAIALGVVFAAITGYAVTRPAALRGKSVDDPDPWVAFCMGLYPDTRSNQDETNDNTADIQDTSSDAGD